MQTLRAKLDAVIASRPLLCHDFYVRWQEGKLAKAELQGYAKEYYSFEKEFPRYISAVHTKMENADHRRALLDNLIHEEAGGENHPELWLQFAEGLGVDRAEVKGHFHSDETEFLLRTYRKFANSSNPIDGLAALYAYEKQQPEVARTKREGLKCFYGLEQPSALAFFKAHEHYDIEHSNTEGDILTQLCQDEAASERAVVVVEETTRALYEFLDGVQRRYQR
ncbi:MAG: CADD family putative folate metabolism protein [Deltaproteobacteria bacterium]|nr:CADD family putative folate metabolism protein [Deltaproteobacteria bacterium]